MRTVRPPQDSNLEHRSLDVVLEASAVTLKVVLLSNETQR